LKLFLQEVLAIFETWAKQGGQKPNLFLLIGATTLCWTI
jgi:hypothetical protein